MPARGGISNRPTSSDFRTCSQSYHRSVLTIAYRGGSNVSAVPLPPVPGAPIPGITSGDPIPPISFNTSCWRSEEHTSELQSLMRISYAVFCLQNKNRCIRVQIGREHTRSHDTKTQRL